MSSPSASPPGTPLKASPDITSLSMYTHLLTTPVIIGHNGASSLFGKTATVEWHGKIVKTWVEDECPVCGHNDIDLSPSAFEQLGNKDIGRLEGITWKFD